MSASTIDYLDLRLQFNSTFTRLYRDSQSGAKKDVSFWRPDPDPNNTEAGFYPVGHIAQSSWDDPTGKVAAILVKATDVTLDYPAICNPVGFELVWRDKNSGAYGDCAVWEPIPPDPDPDSPESTYISLGHVCTPNYSEPDPASGIVRCVRADLLVSGVIGDKIWDDTGSGAYTDFSAWSVDPPHGPLSGKIFLSPGTFIGNPSHHKPKTSHNAWALKLDEQTIDPPEPLPIPELTSTARPAELQPDTVNYVIILPWFAVQDPNLSQVEQIMHSPTYRLERTDRFKLEMFGYNTTKQLQTITDSLTLGTSGSSSETFSSTTGIEFEAETNGVPPAPKFSMKLSQSFTHSETTTEGWSGSKTRTYTVNVPVGIAVAAYSVYSEYKLYRKDNTEVSVPVNYDAVESIIWVQFPNEPIIQASSASL